MIGKRVRIVSPRYTAGHVGTVIMDGGDVFLVRLDVPCKDTMFPELIVEGSELQVIETESQ